MQDIVSVRIAAVSRFQALDRLKLVDYRKSAVESSANGIKRYFVIAFLDPLIKLTLRHFLYTHIKTESVLPALHKIMVYPESTVLEHTSIFTLSNEIFPRAVSALSKLAAALSIS